MTSAKQRLEQKINERAKAAEIKSDTNSLEFLERALATSIEEAAKEIEGLRLDLATILHTATASSLTITGYKNALDRVKTIATQALGRI